MTTFLLVCDHRKQIVSVSGIDDPRIYFKCTKCAQYILGAGQWNFHDIRVYRANEKDECIVGDGRQTEVQKRFKQNNAQLDWIDG